MTTENAPESESFTLVPQQGQDSLGVDPDVEVVGHGQGQNLGQGSVIEQFLWKPNYVNKVHRGTFRGQCHRTAPIEMELYV